MQPQANRTHTLKAVHYRLAIGPRKPAGPPIRFRLRLLLTAIVIAAAIALVARQTAGQTIPPPPGRCIRLDTGQTVWMHPSGRIRGMECLPPNIIFYDE